MLLICLLNLFLVRAQKDVVTFLQAPEISQGLAKEYLTPLSEMMQASLNSGWNTTAKPHRFLGFDVSLNMSFSSTPTDKRGYYVDHVPEFDKYYTVDNFSIAANIAGTTLSNPIINSKADGRSVELPKGQGEDKISLPVLTAGVGLPYNTELRIKLRPKMNNGNIGEVAQYGVGFKHSIKEYVPVLDNIPILSLSVFGAYSLVSNDIAVVYPSNNILEQQLEGDIKGYLGSLLVGIDVPVLSAYMGIGYSSSTVDYALIGNYYMGDVSAQEVSSNPLDISYEYGNLVVDLGAKVKLGMVEIFAAYTPGKYGVFNVGAGISLR